MRYLVVIASIRQSLPGFEETMAQIRSTFVEPAELVVIDGQAGKAAALNRAAREILPGSDAPIYVTMDDDVLLGADWQAKVSAAMEALPQVGAIGLWPGDEHGELVGAHRYGPWREAGSTRYRLAERGHHLNGAFIAYRREVALKLWPQPETAERYQVWEDAWRGRRVQALGWELAMIECDPPRFIHYPDPQEYLDRKARELETTHQSAESMLATSGIADPLLLRIRRRLARIKQRFR